MRVYVRISRILVFQHFKQHRNHPSGIGLRVQSYIDKKRVGKKILGFRNARNL